MAAKIRYSEGGRVAELVARPPTVPKVRGSNHGKLERCLFELMTDEKYRIIHMSHMGSVLQITSR